jgi:hypothetical protein
VTFFGKKKGSIEVADAPSANERLCLKLLSERHANEFVGDVIFVHGMGGDPFSTWAPTEEGGHWGKWLAQRRKDLRIWTLGYPASPSFWTGNAMPLQDRAVSVLALLKADGIGKQPICFITHSLGGLLVKQLLQVAINGGTDEYTKLGTAVCGVVFLSSPHTGSDVASVIHKLSGLLRTTPVIEDLRDDGALLRTLNSWYIQNVEALGIKNKVFFEMRDTMGVRVVDENSAAMNVKGTIPIPVDANHAEICKPISKDAPVYKIIREFLDETLPGEIISEPEPPNPDPEPLIPGPVLPPKPKANHYKTLFLSIGALLLSVLSIWGIKVLKSPSQPLGGEVATAMINDLAKYWFPQKEICKVQIQGREKSGICFQHNLISLLKDPLNQHPFNRYQDFTAVFGIRFVNGKGGAWIVRAQNDKTYYMFKVTPPDDPNSGAMLTLSLYEDGKDQEIGRVPFSPVIDEPGDTFTITLTAKENRFEHAIKRLREDEAHPLETLVIPPDHYHYREGGVGFRGIDGGEFLLQRFEIHPS